MQLVPNLPRLLTLFASSLDSGRQYFRSDLDPNYLIFLEDFDEKVNFKKNQQTATKIMKNVPSMQKITLKAPITTAADDKYCDFFPNFRKK